MGKKGGTNRTDKAYLHGFTLEVFDVPINPPRPILMSVLIR